MDCGISLGILVQKNVTTRNPTTPEFPLLPLREDVARTVGSTAFIATNDPASEQWQSNLLRGLGPVVAQNLDRHLEVQKE